MSARFKVGDLVVRNPEGRDVAGWPYGDEVCRVVDHYPTHIDIFVVPVNSPPKPWYRHRPWFAAGFTAVAAVAPRPTRRNDLPTSKAAAKVSRVTLAEKVLDLLTQYPAGLTGEEIATLLNARLNSVTPRCAQLRRLGLVEGSGHLHSGQIVWMLAGKAAV